MWTEITCSYNYPRSPFSFFVSTKCPNMAEVQLFITWNTHRAANEVESILYPRINYSDVIAATWQLWCNTFLECSEVSAWKDKDICLDEYGMEMNVAHFRCMKNYSERLYLFLFYAFRWNEPIKDIQACKVLDGGESLSWNILFISIHPYSFTWMEEKWSQPSNPGVRLPTSFWSPKFFCWWFWYKDPSYISEVHDGTLCWLSTLHKLILTNTRFSMKWIFFKCSTLTACHHAVLTSTKHNSSISTEKKKLWTSKPC